MEIDLAERPRLVPDNVLSNGHELDGVRQGDGQGFRVPQRLRGSIAPFALPPLQRRSALAQQFVQAEGESDLISNAEISDGLIAQRPREHEPIVIRAASQCIGPKPARKRVATATAIFLVFFENVRPLPCEHAPRLGGPFRFSAAMESSPWTGESRRAD